MARAGCFNRAGRDLSRLSQAMSVRPRNRSQTKAVPIATGARRTIPPQGRRFLVRRAISLISVEPRGSRTGSKICRDQIVRAPAAADIHLGSGGAYQVAIGIERVQKTRFIVAGIRLDSLQRILLYEKRCLDSAVVPPKSYGTPRAVI